MNKKKKGDKAEREVYKIFESWGYIVNPAPRTMRRIFVNGKIIYVSQRNDHWSHFDGEARRRGEGVHFQVKSNYNDAQKVKRSIECWAREYMHPEEYFHIWLRVARKGYVRYLWTGTQWIKDFYTFDGEEKKPFELTT